MKSGNWKIVPALSALALATMFAPYAHAGCGLYTPVRHPASWQPQIASPRLVLAALAIDEEAATPHEPSIVGTWKEKWIAEAGSSSEFPVGSEFDASYSQWHSDGTEINVSGLRAPLTGDVCLGEWRADLSVEPLWRLVRLHRHHPRRSRPDSAMADPRSQRGFNHGKIHRRSVGRVGQCARSRAGQCHRNQSDHGNRIPES